jgi:hypothetical protein
MCSSMRVFCVFIWIARLGRGTSDPFHERQTAHPDRLGEVVGGGLSASDHEGVDTVGDGRVGVADASGEDMDRDAGQQQGGGVRMPQVVQPGAG